MRFLRNLFIGYRAFYKAFWFIIEHKMYWYVGIPAILMLGIYQMGHLIQLHTPTTSANNMNDIVWYMIRLLIEISISILLMRFAKYLVVILLSPLLSHLSQKVEFVLTGNEYKFDLALLISDVKRGFRIAIRNIMWEYFFFIIVYLIARLGWSDAEESPLFYLIFVIGFFYYGFSFMDYVNERLRLNVDQSVQFARKNRGLAIAIGSIYSIMIWVPVDLKALFDWSSFGETADGGGPFVFIYHFIINLFLWMCAAFAPIWSIVAATIAMDDVVNLKEAKLIVAEKNELSTTA
ncbi:MAG TPA: EI24 domain-containing protein [Fluviicola sp.]|nr:EI24 domain-containing protein [Fluviicola sp.]